MLLEAEAGKLWPTVSEHCLYNFFKRVRRSGWYMSACCNDEFAFISMRERERESWCMRYRTGADVSQDRHLEEATDKTL